MSKREDAFLTALVFNAECKPKFRQRPGCVSNVLCKLSRLAARARRQEVALCNDSSYCNAQSAAGFPDRAKIEKELTKITKETGVKFDYPRDPRGAVLHFRTPNTGMYDNLGGTWAL